jgi:hypothetical protein
MDANQLGRRNLTPDAFRLALGRRYNRSKKKHGGDRKSEESKDQSEPLISTAAKLATTYGVSEATVKRAGKFAEIGTAAEFQTPVQTPRPAIISIPLNLL